MLHSKIIGSYLITSLDTNAYHTHADSGDLDQRPHLRVPARPFTFSYDYLILFNSCLIWAKSADDKLMIHLYFIYFVQKIESVIYHENWFLNKLLFPQDTETIC